MKSILTFLILFIALAAIAQETPPPLPPPPPPPPEPAVEGIFKVQEQYLIMPGCEECVGDTKGLRACSHEKMMDFIYTHLKTPKIARENNVTGTVVIRFSIDKDGKIDRPEIVRDIGAQCGKEALRVVRLMAETYGLLIENSYKWRPGKSRGKGVRVYFNLPIKFK